MLGGGGGDDRRTQVTAFAVVVGGRGGGFGGLGGEETVTKLFGLRIGLPLSGILAFWVIRTSAKQHLDMDNGE